MAEVRPIAEVDRVEHRDLGRVALGDPLQRPRRQRLDREGLGMRTL